MMAEREFKYIYGIGKTSDPVGRVVVLVPADQNRRTRVHPNWGLCYAPKSCLQIFTRVPAETSVQTAYALQEMPVNQQARGKNGLMS